MPRRRAPARDIQRNVDRYGRGREDRVRVATRLIRLHSAPAVGHDRLRLRVMRLHDGALGRIAHLQRRGGALGMVDGVGNDDGHRLAVEPHLVVLEDVEALA
jgi:hypothetical protein